MQKNEIERRINELLSYAYKLGKTDVSTETYKTIITKQKAELIQEFERVAAENKVLKADLKAIQERQAEQTKLF